MLHNSFRKTNKSATSRIWYIGQNQIRQVIIWYIKTFKNLNQQSGQLLLQLFNTIKVSMTLELFKTDLSSSPK